MNPCSLSGEGLSRRELCRRDAHLLDFYPPKHGYLGGRHDFCPKCDADLILRKQLETNTQGN